MVEKSIDQIIARELAKQFTAEQIAEILTKILDSREPERNMASEADNIVRSSPTLKGMLGILGADTFILKPETRLELFEKYADELFAEIPAADIVQALHAKQKASGFRVDAPDSYARNYFNDLYVKASQYGRVDVLRAIDDVAMQDEKISLSSGVAMAGALINNKQEAIYYLLVTNPGLEERWKGIDGWTNMDRAGRPGELMLTREQIHERIDAAKQAVVTGIFAAPVSVKEAISIEASLMALGTKGITMDGSLSAEELASARNVIGAQDGVDVSTGEIALRLTQLAVEKAAAVNQP